MKFTLMIPIILLVAATNCSKSPEDIASLSAPIAYAFARNALEQNKPAGQLFIETKWENLSKSEGGWPSGNLLFTLSSPEFEGKSASVQYILDGTHTASALVTSFLNQKSQYKINLYESAIIMGQTKTIESYFQKLTQDIKIKLSGKKVVVMEFQGLMNQKSILGKRISESIITFLVRDNITVMERKLLDPILKEFDFQQKGLTDGTGKEVRTQIGAFLNADTIITGTLKPDKEEIVINIRAIDISSGMIIAANQTIIPTYLFRESDLIVTP